MQIAKRVRYNVFHCIVCANSDKSVSDLHSVIVQPVFHCCLSGMKYKDKYFAMALKKDRLYY